MAEDDLLSFSYTTPGSWLFQLDGFSTDQVSVYDVTDPNAIVRLNGVSIDGLCLRLQRLLSGRSCHSPHLLGRHRYRLSQCARASSQDTPSNLQATANGADQIIITHPDFVTDALRLRDLRAAQGLRSVVVDVQDVYDEFGYGIVGVAPIHDFLAYAYAHWQAPAPSYVVLVGDGHYDPKGYLATGQGNYIPAYPRHGRSLDRRDRRRQSLCHARRGTIPSPI